MRKSILVIDDEEELLEELQYFLEYEGYEVLTANSGKDGLRMARSRHPDLIILDVKMPTMDGMEVLRRLKSDSHTEETPVMMLTGVQSVAVRAESIENKADKFIQKPFEPNHLKEEVRKSLELSLL